MPVKTRSSDLPFGSEFSPKQVDLVVLLELAFKHGTDWRSFENAVRARYFYRHDTSDRNKSKLAQNTKLALRAYGLINEDDTTLTKVGTTLYDLRDDEAALYEAFARHILKNCHGMNFVQCILDMHAAGERITLNDLRHWLGERGINVPSAGRHMSTLRLWLERAGVFVSKYRVDQARLQEILAEVAGMVEEIVNAAYPKALAILHTHGHLRVFGDQHLLDKLTQWSAFWCKKYARRHQKRPHTKYSAESACLGRERPAAARRGTADRRAYFAQDWYRKGISLERIAAKLGATVRTVRNLLQREVSRWFGMPGKSGKNSIPSTLHKARQVPERLPDFPPFAPGVDPEPPIPDPLDGRRRKNDSQVDKQSEIDRIGEQIGDLLKAYWQRVGPSTA